jgi:hypothetical protein
MNDKLYTQLKKHYDEQIARLEKEEVFERHVDKSVDPPVGYCVVKKAPATATDSTPKSAPPAPGACPPRRTAVVPAR